MCVVRGARLPVPGAQLAVDIRNGGGLLTRGEDGAVRALPTPAGTAATSCCRAGRRPPRRPSSALRISSLLDDGLDIAPHSLPFGPLGGHG